MSKYVYPEVEVDLSDFNTEELIEELEKRGNFNTELAKDLLEQIYYKRRTNQDYEQELDQLIYTALGKII